MRRLAGHGAANVGAALANAQSQLAVLRRHAEELQAQAQTQTQTHLRLHAEELAGEEGQQGRGAAAGGMGPEFVGVFEDDLMMTGSADKVKRAVFAMQCRCSPQVPSTGTENRC